VFGFQVVSFLNGSLIDSSTEFTLFGFSFSGTDDNVKGVDFVDVELVLLNFLVIGFFVDNDVVAINKVFLKLMAQNSLNWIAAETFSSGEDQRGDFIIFLFLDANFLKLLAVRCKRLR